MDTPFVNSSSLTTQDVFTRSVSARIKLIGNTNVALLNAVSETSGIIPYIEINGVQPTPADSGANFGTLDSNAAPSTVGILMLCGDADQIISAEVSPCSIISAAMTAGVVSAAGTAFGPGKLSVTPSKNVAVVVSCTGLDLDAAIADHYFVINIVYKYKNG